MENKNLKIIDFGLAKKYVDKHGKHIAHRPVNSFKGNRIFASYNQMCMNTTSRKDDLISLFYILIYLIDESLPFIHLGDDLKSINQQFKDIKEEKKELTP